MDKEWYAMVIAVLIGVIVLIGAITFGVVVTAGQNHRSRDLHVRACETIIDQNLRTICLLKVKA